MTLDGLTPDFATRVTELLSVLRSRGVEMRVYSTLRTPWEQAKLWRQGRTTEEIAARCAKLRAARAGRIAACIEGVGAQHGRKVTNAWPGASWHNHGEAVDCFRVVDGQANWDPTSYQQYAQAARALNLKAGGDFGDWPHTQFRHGEPPGLWTAEQIEIQLCERWPTFAALKGVQ